MTDPVYTAHYDSNGKPFVDGPGNGCGYYHGTLWPNSRLSSEEDAKAAAFIANEAFRQGYLKAQQDMRHALGVL